MQSRDQHQVHSARQSGSSGTQPHRQTMPSTPSASLPSGRQQHSEESWIEIGSRPSSSSLSSVADEIITTGLRVQHDSNTHRRRRRAVSVGQFQVGTGYRVRTGGGGNSSQEEYDESESESDPVLTSSTEGIGPSPLQHELRRPSRNPHSAASSETMSEREGDDEDEDDDDDENATAVNYPRSTERQFKPRPNAFSHPPTEHAIRAEQGASSMPYRPAARPASQRHSFPQHSPYNAVSPNYQPDHDEALRASLSTLLSAAAAVRGLPKPGQTRVNTSNPSTRVDPTSLRLVPESVALGDIPEDTNSNHLSSRESPSISSPTSSDKSKRKASPPTTTNPRSNSRDRRVAKKARRVGPLVEEISPTLLTWVVSAGVVVLVSALSFSAGYVVGKEAGHAETVSKLGAVGSEAGRCGKEAASGIGLRRLRWTGASAVVRV